MEYCMNKRQTPIDSDGISLNWAISYLICILTNIKKKNATEENWTLDTISAHAPAH